MTALPAAPAAARRAAACGADREALRARGCLPQPAGDPHAAARLAGDALHLDHRAQRGASRRRHPRHRVHRVRQACRACGPGGCCAARCAVAASSCCCTCSSPGARAWLRARHGASQARLRPRARARPAMAVHQRAYRAGAARARDGCAVRFRAPPRGRRSATTAGISRCRKARAPMPRATLPRACRRSSSVPARATCCATGMYAGYAAVADHAARSPGLKVLLCGGRTPLEQRTAAQIAARMRAPCTNLAGAIRCRSSMRCSAARGRC